jgi:hypothetical protein
VLPAKRRGTRLGPEPLWAQPGNWVPPITLTPMPDRWELGPEDLIWLGWTEPLFAQVLAPIAVPATLVRPSALNVTHPLPRHYGTPTAADAAAIDQELPPPSPPTRAAPSRNDPYWRLAPKRLFERMVRHPQYLSNLQDRMLRGTVPPPIESFILATVFGKPTEEGLHTAEAKQVPVKIVHEFVKEPGA